MRGKVPDKFFKFILIWITPAYAGKSGFVGCSLCGSEDHPRVCGEKDKPAISCIPSQGSPPRMRGKATIQAINTASFRITPAYAGKSSFLLHHRLCF